MPVSCSTRKDSEIGVFIVFLLLASFYVGWNIGANDTANCIGPSVGSGIIHYRQAVILAAAFTLLGALLQGHTVVENVGKGIITERGIPRQAILVALLSSGFLVTLATIWGVPVSTGQVIVGAIAGIGLALNADLSGRELLRIVACWVVCPILTMIMSFLGYKLFAAILSRVKNRRFVYALTRYLMIISSCYVAYSFGANNVGKATGLVANLGTIDTTWLTVLGGAAIAVGVLTFGKRVTMTVGKSITPLNLPGAMSTQFSAAFGIHAFAMLGVPVSTSQAIVGAVLGVGLTKGMRAVSKRTLFHIAVGWVATPVLSGLVAFLVCRIILRAGT